MKKALKQAIDKIDEDFRSLNLAILAEDEKPSDKALDVLDSVLITWCKFKDDIKRDNESKL